MQWKFESIFGPLGRPLGSLAWSGESMLVSDPADSRILSFGPGGGEPSVFKKYTNRINGIAFGPDGLLYGCQEGSRRVVQYLESGAMKVTATLLDGRQHNHPNQIAIDRKGRIWFSDTYNDVLASGPQVFPYLPHQSVLRMSLHGRPHTQWSIERATFDTQAPRGVAVSPDQRTLYVAEMDTRDDGVQELRAYPIDERGLLGPYALLHRFGKDARGAHRGISGICVDAEGYILACAGSSRSGPGATIYVFGPDGRIREAHGLPCDEPLNCAFGDADLSSLYVTTQDGRLLRAVGLDYRGESIAKI
jgi:gluconolactonase